MSQYMLGINNEIMLFSNTLVLRLLKMRFGVFKRAKHLIIKVCRHKCDLDTRLMNFSNIPANFVSTFQVVFELQQKLSVALEVSLSIQVSHKRTTCS